MHNLALAIALLFLLLWALDAMGAPRLHHERWYREQWCFASQNAALTVEQLPDGTWPDCLSLGYAIEVDFADKAWKEGIGQALHYARMTGKRPGVLVIMEHADDCRYLARVRATAKTIQIPEIAVWETGPWAGRCEP